MKQKKNKRHPMLLNHTRIKDEGIVVFDNVDSLPDENNPFVSPDYVICMCHRGTMSVVYDSFEDVNRPRSVVVVFPNHALTMIEKSPDFRASLIVVSASVMSDPMLQIIKHFKYRYEQQPRVMLNDHDFKILKRIVEVMKETSGLDIPNRRTVMVRQVDFFLRMLNYYRQKTLNDETATERISAQFQAALNDNYRKHRNVAFYADIACLTPKYFSTVIRKQTGMSASYWISSRVMAEAKRLLHTLPNHSVKAIADMLGFSDQNDFSRFFKKESGMSPSEFRNMD